MFLFDTNKMGQLLSTPDPTLKYVINMPHLASDNSCPSIDKLIDYNMGCFDSDPEKHQAIKEHVLNCIFCLDLEMFKEMRAH